MATKAQLIKRSKALHDEVSRLFDDIYDKEAGGDYTVDTQELLGAMEGIFSRSYELYLNLKSRS